MGKAAVEFRADQRVHRGQRSPAEEKGIAGMAKGMALITGASSGIGAELARLCARDGYGLILVARRADRLAQLAGTLTSEYGVTVRTIAIDLADPVAPIAIHEQ